MGFNKRYFNMEKFAMYYKEDPKNGITKCVGKTDGFMYDNDETKSVLDLWNENEIDQANLVIEKFIARKIQETCI